MNRPTVEANANNLKHLTIQEILEYHLPAGENLSVHVFAQLKERCMLAIGAHELIWKDARNYITYINLFMSII